MPRAPRPVAPEAIAEAAFKAAREPAREYWIGLSALKRNMVIPTVRIEHAAASQFQLDVYGELVDSVSAAAKAGISPSERETALITSVVEHVERVWDLPDQGLWSSGGNRVTTPIRRSPPGPRSTDSSDATTSIVGRIRASSIGCAP